MPEALRCSKIPGALETAIGHLNDGVEMLTCYSGQGSPEMAADFIQVAFRQLGLTRTEASFAFEEACDKKHMCQRVLESFPPRTRAGHLYGDLMDRLSWGCASR